MGKPVVGEVVVLPFPQANLKGGKRRPALVVADLTGDDLILCQITSQARSDGYSIPLAIADFERGRLMLDSFVRPNRLFTVDQSAQQREELIATLKARFQDNPSRHNGLDWSKVQARLEAHPEKLWALQATSSSDTTGRSPITPPGDSAECSGSERRF
jgi:mRNA interferase MazF